MDEYRRTFAPAFELVFEGLQEKLALSPTGRPEKSTKSLLEKLQRESARLSQVQDMAGCRVVVRGIVEQDDAVARIQRTFERVVVVDRRVRPSHGYRAVHAIVTVLEKAIEVQVRTGLQHLWAEYSEKLSDRFGVEVKYGGGAAHIRTILLTSSTLVASLDAADAELQVLSASLEVARDRRERIAALEHQVRVLREQVTDSQVVANPDVDHHRRALRALADARDQSVDVGALEVQVLALQLQLAELHETTRHMLLSGIEGPGNRA